MRPRSVIVGVAGIATAVAGVVWFLFGFQISALQKPGRVETFVATGALHWFVGRASRGPLPPKPGDTPEDVSTGKTMVINECSLCHGTYGRRPTQMGRSLYPPAPPLDSSEVQSWTNRELFWIIKHGIRNTGMPGFAQIYSDQEIWELVDYIRSLKKPESNSTRGG